MTQFQVCCRVPTVLRSDSTSSKNGVGPGDNMPSLTRRSGVDQNFWVEQTLRIERLLSRAQSRGEQRRPLLVVPRPVITAHRMVMGDGAARTDQCSTGGALDYLPLRQQIPVPSERVEGEIRSGSIRIDMSETTGDLPRSPGDLANRCFGCRLDRVVKGLEPFPRDRGFEGVGYDRPPHEPLARVGHPDERVAP